MSDAAKQLGITAPSLSQSIKRLENDLQCRVFYRTRTGVALTPSGQKVLEGALETLRRLDSLAENRAIRIVIGAHPVVASYALPSAIAKLSMHPTRIDIELRHGMSREIQHFIQTGKVDVGIVVNPVRAPDLVIRELGKDLVTVWTKRLDAVHDRIICDPDLHQTQLILKRWRGRPKSILATSSLELCARMASKGIGMAILPERVVGLLGEKFHKVHNSPELVDTIGLIHRPEFGKSEAERYVISVLRNALN